MDGKFFSQDFLLDGIKTTPVWEALPDEALNIFIADLKVQILDRRVMTGGSEVKLLPNLLGSMAVYRFKRAE